MRRSHAGLSGPVVRHLVQSARRRLPALLSAAVIAAVLYVVFWVLIPSRYIVLGPGPAPDVATLVTPVGPSDRGGAGGGAEAGGGGGAGGRFLLTTVQASSATPLELAQLLSGRGYELYPRSYLVPAGMSDETYGDWALASMSESQLAALRQAWRYLGRSGDLVSDGGRVFWVAPGSPAYGQLEPGDAITGWSLGNRSGPFVTADDFEQAVTAAFSEGSASGAATLDLDVRRGASIAPVSFPVTGADLAAWPFLGLALGAENPRVQPAPPVSFPPGDIGGPSGGLMLTLQIIDDFTPGDLAGGRVVAGSGTIGPEGEVGPVGGVGLKLRGAVAAGATLFLVPRDDYYEAQAAVRDLGLDVRLVPVGSLGEALDALRGEAASLTAKRGAAYNESDLDSRFPRLVEQGVRVAEGTHDSRP